MKKEFAEQTFVDFVGKKPRSLLIIDNYSVEYSVKINLNVGEFSLSGRIFYVFALLYKYDNY